MTDPWSVQGTNEITLQDNLPQDPRENNTQNKTVVQRNNSQTLGFEDSFIHNNISNTLLESANTTPKEGAESKHHQPLPDSKTYLQSLERRLEKLKTNSKLVDALSEKRDDCLRSMLQDTLSNVCNNDLLLELETSLINSDSAVQNLYRQIQPIQPVTVGETVHIVKYDQLEEQRLEAEAEASNELEENLPASR